jgi:hypothetical protein
MPRSRKLSIITTITLEICSLIAYLSTCRYLYKGKAPQCDIGKVIGPVQEYQVK